MGFKGVYISRTCFPDVSLSGSCFEKLKLRLLFSASTGKRSDFVLPDRDQCLSMDKPFLKNYRDLLIKTCHKRGAFATDGMAAHLLLPVENGRYGYEETLEKVKRSHKYRIT